jgi:hypothetical protein
VTLRYRFVAGLLAGIVASLVMASCGNEDPTEYSSDNRDAFLAACVDPDADGLFQQRLCLCAYEEAEASMPFERFREINEELESADAPTLPDDLQAIVASCIIEEGDL